MGVCMYKFWSNIDIFLYKVCMTEGIYTLLSIWADTKRITYCRTRCTDQRVRRPEVLYKKVYRIYGNRYNQFDYTCMAIYGYIYIYMHMQHMCVYIINRMHINATNGYSCKPSAYQCQAGNGGYTCTGRAGGTNV